MKNLILVQRSGFLILTGLQFLISAADWMLIVLLQIIVFELTHSAFNIMLLVMCELIPMLLLGAWAGAVADRNNLKKIVIYSTVARLCIILTLLLPLMQSHLLSIFVIAALGAACNRFFVPAASAMLPGLVPSERLPVANSVSMGARMAGMAAGTLMAGTVASHHGHLPVVVTIELFLLIAGALGMALPVLRVMPKDKQETGTWGGLRLAVSRYGFYLVLPMASSMLVMLALGGFEILAIMYVTQTLERPATDVGLLFGAYGIGMFAGLALASWKPIMPRYTAWVAGVLTLMCASIWGVSRVHTLESALPLIAVAGIAEGLVIALGLLRLYQQVAGDFHARVIALLDTGTGAAFLLAVMLTGMMADRFVASTLLEGLAMALTCILILGMLGMRVISRWLHIRTNHSLSSTRCDTK